jgi:hypothetical protein
MAIEKMEGSQAVKRLMAVAAQETAADYKDSAEFTKDLQKLEHSIAAMTNVVNNPKFIKWCQALQSQNTSSTVLRTAKTLQKAITNLEDDYQSLVEELDDIG